MALAPVFISAASIPSFTGTSSHPPLLELQICSQYQESLQCSWKNGVSNARFSYGRLPRILPAQLANSKGLIGAAGNLRAGSGQELKVEAAINGPNVDFNRVVTKAEQKIKASEKEAFLSLEDEIIQRELQKERERIASTLEDEAAQRQSKLDKARKEMREWWIEKWDAKKRSEGWGDYEKCWVLKPGNTSLATNSVVLSGEGVLVGAAPLVSGTIKPYVVDLPMVSSVHAHVYGKDVVKSYKKYVREYFVVDLGSTNGTYLNKLKLRPRTEVKLSPGDELKFGDEGAVFVIEKQN